MPIMVLLKQSFYNFRNHIYYFDDFSYNLYFFFFFFEKMLTFSYADYLLLGEYFLIFKGFFRGPIVDLLTSRLTVMSSFCADRPVYRAFHD